MALVAHTVSDNNFFDFSNIWLCIETLTSIILFIYNPDRPMLITWYEIVDAMSETKKNLHAKYGIHGFTDTLTINSTKLFGYKYQFQSSKILFFYIDAQRGVLSTQSIQVTLNYFLVDRLGQSKQKINQRCTMLHSNFQIHNSLVKGCYILKILSKEWKRVDCVENTMQVLHSQQRD